jgi:serine/threonine protein kinase
MDEPLSVTHAYTLRQKLFQRGMAVSYLARDEQLEEDVVIEHVSLQARGSDPGTEDWLKQYRSIAVRVMRLRHPNHVAIRDFWTDFRTAVFLVKQYDPGVTLEVLLQPRHARELTGAERIGLCQDVLRGLAALHAHGILHRDVKPYGIYVVEGQDLVAQIDHFHLAVSAVGEYMDEDLCGTPVYLAPELLGGRPRRYSRRSDVYAAGLVCLEVLSGISSHDLLRREGLDLEGGPAALMEEVRSRGGHVREKTVRELLSGRYAEAICRATRANPCERFADARAFYDAFEGR